MTPKHSTDLASPIANLQKGAGRADAKPKRAVTQPTPGQLRKAADTARKAGVPPLAEKYDKVAADTARYEALALKHGADLSEEGFNAVLKKVATPK